MGVSGFYNSNYNPVTGDEDVSVSSTGGYTLTLSDIPQTWATTWAREVTGAASNVTVTQGKSVTISGRIVIRRIIRLFRLQDPH